MGILEEILEEVKRLNKNLQVTNVELSTVDESVMKKVKEVPMKKEEASKEDVKEFEEPTQDYSKDYVLSLGKEFVKNADDSDKKAFKEKLSELNSSKLSTVESENYPIIVDFMKARLDA
ncbi:hypothetical protein JL769_13045 [Staphylococcus pseudintermedius]|uniref:hypothetical protein n=1 Tax=Staphylococcus pseudintermedius TaxID=283734 RepID=UPI000D736523|nr:hypothetical protein [Staphylococcus pseudintermedius]MCE5766874.1 hypothetical protein [Staphylococcus pseudintermedius]MDT0813662.1 hypothetical protein [Staphylococcus pseudintermedius]PWZ59386.1 hypothetical protein DD929_10275 [Staphylococcus pseudintermedius]HAR5686001.1 hypothetical protein [Staphylococcus pseudintermedius]